MKRSDLKYDPAKAAAKKARHAMVYQRESGPKVKTKIQALGKRGGRLYPDDRAASALCKELAGQRCAMAGPTCSGDLDAHHVVKRRHNATRFDQRNLVCLCRGHHSRAEVDEPAFREWFTANRPEGLLDELIRLGHTEVHL